MDDKIQDEELAKCDVKDHERRLEDRRPWESTWRAIDERFPDGAGGFLQTTPGRIRGEGNYDTTHITANERFAAAGVAITTPAEKDYIHPRFSSELMKERDVQLWCEAAGKQLYAIRYAWRSGFGIAANEDWDQLGRYGTSPMWVDVNEQAGGLFYRTIHLSEITIDVDYAGMVDTVDRKITRTLRQIVGFFGKDALTPKMTRALEDDKMQEEFEILHVVAPNQDYDKDKLDWRRLPIGSRYMALDEKLYLRRKGYFTYPISVSRHMTSAGEKYGRSPGIKMLPTINGVNAMKHTTLRAGHKAVDPALLFDNEDGITRLSTKPGGLNPGMMRDGQPRVGRMPGGEQGIPYAVEMIQDERSEIKTAFLEEFYKILTDPNSRMTTTEVLEVMSKQGILVRPYASRYETEKQNPVSQRELDCAIRWNQLDPFPPQVLEAGEWPRVDYDNMLAAMARAESTSKGLRFIEALTPLAQVDPTIYDYLDTDVMVPSLADDIGVDASWIRDPKEVKIKRAAREEQQQVPDQADALNQGSQAFLNIAKANQLRGVPGVVQ
jgi:hypothetical protein